MNHPTTVSEVTPEWLTEVLAPGDSRGSVNSFEATRLHGGAVAEVNRLQLRYRSGLSGPSSVILKSSLTTDDVWNTRDASSLDRREVQFYKELSPDVGVDVPRIYFAGFETSTNSALILMEDLAGMRAVDQHVGGSSRDVGDALRYLAQLHRAWWNSPRLEEFDWLFRGAEPNDYCFAHGQFSSRAEPFIEFLGPGLTCEVADIIRAASKRAYQIQIALAEPPVTLNHGDFRLANILFGSKRRVVAIDWSLPSVARPALDVAAILMTGLSPEMRRTHEIELLGHYFEQLSDSFTAGLSYADFEKDLRLGLLSRLPLQAGVISTLPDLPASTLEPIRRHMCERLQILAEWNCGEAIPN